MAQKKKLTYEMKKVLTENGLDPHNFMYVKNLPTELHLVNKKTNEKVVLKRNSI